MRSGALRCRITIAAPAAVTDPFALPSGPPTAVLSCWAAITAATSKEIYALGAGFTSQVTHKIKIRYPDTLPTAGMTVTYESRSFTVQTAVDPTERKRELDVMCLEEPK
jgi:SPP1 family predicted phage head-tail adaptor